MIVLWELFKSFFTANIFGYGGGPASIPLVFHEVEKHQWMSQSDFSNGIALANALPGPIATKLAVSVGYPVMGILGSIVAIIATVLPSAIIFIVIFKKLDQYKKSKVMLGIMLMVQPVVAMLMFSVTYTMGKTSIVQLGWIQFVILAIISYIALEKMKYNPALVILGAFVYGGLILPLL